MTLFEEKWLREESQSLHTLTATPIVDDADPGTL
jgi:hypothetical protein